MAEVHKSTFVCIFTQSARFLRGARFHRRAKNGRERPNPAGNAPECASPRELELLGARMAEKLVPHALPASELSVIEDQMLTGLALGTS